MLIQEMQGKIYDLQVNGISDGHILTLDLGGKVDGWDTPVLLQLEAGKTAPLTAKTFIRHLDIKMSNILEVTCEITGISHCDEGGDIITGRLYNIRFSEDPELTEWRDIFDEDYEHDFVENLYNEISDLDDLSFEGIAEYMNKYYGPNFSFGVLLGLSRRMSEYFATKADREKRRKDLYRYESKRKQILKTTSPRKNALTK